MESIIDKSILYDGIRTTMSLPKEILEKLKSASFKTDIPIGFLAVLCLRLIVREEKVQLEERVTILYNKENCEEKINVYLNASEQNGLRLIRATRVISISYLMVISVETYLTRIVNLLCSRNKKRHEKVKNWVTGILCIFNDVQRNLKVYSDKICVVTMVFTSHNRRRGS